MPAQSRQRGRHARPRPKQWGMPRWKARTVMIFSAMVLLASGIGHAVVTGLDSQLERVDPFHGLSHRPSSGNGTNFLIVGTDGRDLLSEQEKQAYSLGGVGCNCTDTIMLVHLSAARSRASVVSIPRDTYTVFPEHTDLATGEHHTDSAGKINSAYTHGGPQLTVRTVEQLTGVRVDHYLEVDFTSFMRTVDALGGVPVCTTQPLQDAYSGLDLAPGTTRLNGGQALQYVRARHISGDGDLGRIKRQQRFLASVIDEANRGGVLMNPVKLRRVVSALLDSVRADPDFGADEMLRLGRAMHGLTVASSEFASVPIADPDHSVPGIGSTVLWDEPKAEKLFEALRHDRPLTAPAAARTTAGPPEGTEPSGPSGQPGPSEQPEQPGPPESSGPPDTGKTREPGGEDIQATAGDKVVCP